MIAAVLLAGCSGTPAGGPAPDPAAAIEPTVLGDLTTGLVSPWSVLPTGDSSALISERDTGRILLLKLDGTIPKDNPFPGSPVYSWGHRNVQGLAFDSDGRLWASEFGASDFDELKLIEPGANYGWPVYEGPSDDPDYVSPQAWLQSTSIASPSGIAIVGDDVWVASLRGETLWQVPIPHGSAGEPIPHLKGEYGRLRDVVVGSDGELWLLTNNTDGRGTPAPGDDRILRLRVAASDSAS